MFYYVPRKYASIQPYKSDHTQKNIHKNTTYISTNFLFMVHNKTYQNDLQLIELQFQLIKLQLQLIIMQLQWQAIKLQFQLQSIESQLIRTAQIDCIINRQTYHIFWKLDLIKAFEHIQKCCSLPANKLFKRLKRIKNIPSSNL